MQRAACGDVNVSSDFIHDDKAYAGQIKQGKRAVRVIVDENVDVAHCLCLVTSHRAEKVERGRALRANGMGMISDASDDFVAA